MPQFVGWWYVGEVLSNFTMPGIGQPGYCTAALTETLLGFLDASSVLFQLKILLLFYILALV